MEEGADGSPSTEKGGGAGGGAIAARRKCFF